MEFKGIKGEWKTGIFSNTSVYVSGGPTICQMLPTDFRHLSDSERDEMRIEIKANALLISKAPEMLEALQQVIRLKDLIEYDESIVNESNIGEASAISQMLNRIETLIKEATEI